MDELADRLPEGARVLDLGCGNGAKIARLAGRFEVTGVDISERQLELARAAAPGASFVQADFVELDFPPRRSTRSPRSTRSSTCLVTSSRRCSPGSCGWLKPGGLFLASLSHVGGEDRIDDGSASTCSSPASMRTPTGGSCVKPGSSSSRTISSGCRNRRARSHSCGSWGVSRSETPTGDDRLLRARAAALDAYLGRDVGLPRERARPVSAAARPHGNRDGGCRVPVRDSDGRCRRHVQPPALPDRGLPGDGRHLDARGRDLGAVGDHRPLGPLGSLLHVHERRLRGLDHGRGGRRKGRPALPGRRPTLVRGGGYRADRCRSRSASSRCVPR